MKDSSDKESQACRHTYKSDIHVTPLLNFLAMGLNHITSLAQILTVAQILSTNGVTISLSCRDAHSIPFFSRFYLLLSHASQ